MSPPDALEKVVIATAGKHPLVLPSKSPQCKGQRELDGAGTATIRPASSSSIAATESNNTACTSPLTITSLEAAAITSHSAAGTSTASNCNTSKNNSCIPKVVSSRVIMSKNSSAGSEEGSPFMSGSIVNQRTPPTQHDPRKLFVGGLPTDVTDVEFLAFFKQFGQVVDSVVMVDRLTKRSRGFGFVTFSTEAEASALLTSIPGKTGSVVINGKQCEVKASTPKPNDSSFFWTYRRDGGSNGRIPLWRFNNPHPYINRGYHSSHFFPINHFDNNTYNAESVLYLPKQQHDNQDNKRKDTEQQLNTDGNQQHVTAMYPAARYHVENSSFPFPAGYNRYPNGRWHESFISSSYPPPTLHEFGTTCLYGPYGSVRTYSDPYLNSSQQYDGNQSFPSLSTFDAGQMQYGYESHYNGPYEQSTPVDLDGGK